MNTKRTTEELRAEIEKLYAQLTPENKAKARAYAEELMKKQEAGK